MAIRAEDTVRKDLSGDVEFELDLEGRSSSEDREDRNMV